MTGPSSAAKAGLAICALLGVLDIVSLAGIGADDGPPVPIVILGVLLGLITLWGVSIAWRGQRKGATIVVVARVISALTALPAFFVDDAPDWAAPVVAVGLLLTVIGVGLIAVALKRGEFPA